MMALAQMEAIAADLADLGGRVSALEQGGASSPLADAIAVPNQFYITTFGTSPSPDMTWTGAWDPFAAYLPGETVRYNGAAYVSVSAIPASSTVLGPLPAPIAGLASTLSGYLPGESSEGVLLPLSPAYTPGKRYGGKCPAIVFEIHFAAGTKSVTFTNPNITTKAGARPAFVHTAVWGNNAEGALAEIAFRSWGPEEATGAMEVNVPGTGTKAWVVLFASGVAGGESAETSVPAVVPLTYLLEITGLTAIAANKPPTEDREHWSLVAEKGETGPAGPKGEKGEPGAGGLTIGETSAPEELAEKVAHEVSATKDANVYIEIKTKKGENFRFRIKVAGKVVGEPAAAAESGAGERIELYKVTVGKKQTLEWETIEGVLEAKPTKIRVQTLN